MRIQNLTLWIVIFLAAALLIGGCSSLGAKATPTPEPEIEEEFNPVVSVTGVVVPAQWARLSLPGAGTISEVLIQEDESVQPGQILIRLQGEERLQAAVAVARLEIAAAQRALNDLYKNPELRSASASQAIVDARLAIRDAERRVKNFSTSSAQADIDQARAVAAILKDKLEDAQEDYKPYAKKPEDNVTRAGYLNKKAEAEKKYDAAVRRLNNLLGNANELDLSEAQADLALGQAQLAVAERDYAIYKDGPDPADVSLAQVRIDNAQAQLTAAESALKDLVLTAPFAGTVSEVYTHANEWIAPGQQALLLADLAHLRIETTDLNEIDVARVEPGDSVSVTFDALPDVLLPGKVTRISSKSAEGSGVNYTVVIELDQIPEKLRWGMTAFVDILVD